VTVLHDLILCVPPEAKTLVDNFGMDHADEVWAAGEEARLAGSDFAFADAQQSPRALRYLTPMLGGLRPVAGRLRARKPPPGA
jgi:hypothetical protein